MILPTATNTATERGSDAWFTGSVWTDELVVAPRPSGLRMHRVTFEPRARTRWHAHPLGQVLHGVSGVGIVGFEARASLPLLPGETVWIAPGERHWHGADPDHLFVHLSVQEAAHDGLTAEWHAAVSDAQYLEALGARA